MSVESSTLAWMHSRSKGTARLVLLAIADHDGDGGAWPSIETLMRRAGNIDRRAVQRAIVNLESLGEIRRVIQAGGTPEMDNTRRPNRYEFLITCPDYCDRTKRHKDIRKPLISFENDGAVEEPPRGRGTARGAVEEPPKPSFNPINRLNKESLVLNREDKSSNCLKSPSLQHIFDPSSGWCNFCEAREDKVA